MKHKIRLGVNVDHVATLRQVRGGTTPYPNLVDAVKASVKGGAEQITIHLREDRRHIQLEDLKVLSKVCPVPLNLEMAATAQMVKFAKKYRPDWVCFVPEKRAELTTEGGLDVKKGFKKMAPMVEKLGRIGIEISMFIEPSIEQVEASYEIGADAVELHTGKWVLLTGAKKEKEWKRLVDAAVWANYLGLNVHAGHGLDYHHSKLINKLPFLQEVNIGHSLICYALEDGLQESVRKMRKILK
ncbi:pyridoxine 5'-phosphate synthase [Bdellovibrio bacteriovorus]|uniref:Pyridoxine 5'-phosphate synthase n=1 Tax=Bdellovibrio bacteriovorus TaxID=959 RepID=A0A150WE97_BDEBC|nr:pyridoxine 5'-phosphate synthase [Bdellovibrio bacteriovorus]KYG61293.1 pyridoxine 5'-phosphate synthase [Bdellovibrio bacteriovorus]KYG65340.1 pyridoxine 5'-phosphate synthase [Bdellovibrio bacteriovorus]